MYKLTFQSGALKGRRLTVKKGSVVLGSGTNCHIQIEEPGIEPRHCIIEWRSDGTVLRALSPSARVLVNDQPQQEVRLHFGDRIELGKTVITFQQAETRVAEHARRIGSIQTLTFISIGLVILFEIVFLAVVSVWHADRVSVPAEQPPAAPSGHDEYAEKLSFFDAQLARLESQSKETPEPEGTVAPVFTPAPEPTPTFTPAPTSTPLPTPTATPEPTPTFTPEPPPPPTATPEPQPTATEVPLPTSTPEPVVTPSGEAVAAPLSTPEPAATPKPTKTPKPTPTPKPTKTPKPTATPKPTPTLTPTPEPTATPVPTATPTPEPTPTPLPTPAPAPAPAQRSAAERRTDISNLVVRFGLQDSAVGVIAHDMTEEGLVLWEQGHLPAAEMKFEQAGIVDPGYFPAFIMKARLLEEEGKIRESRREWKALLKSTRDTYWHNYVQQELDAFDERN